MAPYTPDSNILVQTYTQDSYEEAVRKLCEPRPPRGEDEDKELEVFIDSTMETASKSLKAAAAVLALGGLAFPPAAIVGAAVGFAAAAVSYFDSQNKMRELLEKLTDNVQRIRKQMHGGFNDLEELITENDFLSEVVSPSNELFAAYMRYLKNANEANKQELIECCKVRTSGGIHIIRTAIAKIDHSTEANFIKKSQKARHFVHKEYVATVNYIYQSLLDVLIAHTFYYTIMSNDEMEKQMQKDGVINLMKEIEIELQGVYDWRKESYFTPENLNPIIEHITGLVFDSGNPSDNVLLWLRNSYPIEDLKEKYVAIVWTHHSDRYHAEHFSAPNPKHTIMFTGLKNSSHTNKSMVVHRITEESTENVDREARKSMGYELLTNLRKKKVENAWDEIPVAQDGFSLVLYWGEHEVAFSESHWDCKYYHSDGANKDYFGRFVRVPGGVITNKRHYWVFYKY